MCISLECLIISSRQSKPLRKVLGGFKFKKLLQMKYIEGEYYTIETKINGLDVIYIWICSYNETKNYLNRLICYINKEEDSNYMTDSSHGHDDSRLASIQEKHWLDLCIEQNKYIPRLQALKLFNISNPKIPIEPNPELEQILIKLLT
jgi:hypothetical protein